MTKKQEKMKCKICDKEITVRRERFGNGGKDSPNKRRFFSDSDEGVCFDYHGNNTWFCNECWEKITERVNFRSINGEK